MTVGMTGTNWAPNSTVTITLVRIPPFALESQWTVTADENGDFTDSSYVVSEEDVGANFLASATADGGYAATAVVLGLDQHRLLPFHRCR